MIIINNLQNIGEAGIKNKKSSQTNKTSHDGLSVTNKINIRIGY